MRGKVIVWKRDFNNPAGSLFGWGFVEEDGTNGNKKTERVYFSERVARYSPIKVGDVVDFELFPPRENSSHQSRSAFKVEKVDSQ